MACASAELALLGQRGLLAIRQGLELVQRADQSLNRRATARAEDCPVAITLDQHLGQAFAPEDFWQAHRLAAALRKRLAAVMMRAPERFGLYRANTLRAVPARASQG